MMRLPLFTYRAPTTLDETIRILAGEGPGAMIVAGGTDLWPNMKRRHQTPATVVSVRRIQRLKGRARSDDGAWRLGAGESLRALERDPALRTDAPALVDAVRSISTPILRNMATIGGNVCLDTRCNYYDQTWEWRRGVRFCMKCEGDVCWTAPGSDRCWAVNSSDSVPVLVALGARALLVGPDGEREVPFEDLFRDDGIDYLTKKKDEVLVDLALPAPGAGRAAYRKVRRRGAFDFPVAAVAVWLSMDGERVAEARIVLNAVGSAPVRSADAEAVLVGQALGDEVIEEAARLAGRPAKPLDNTDHLHTWRKKMIRVETRRALASLR